MTMTDLAAALRGSFAVRGRELTLEDIRSTEAGFAAARSDLVTRAAEVREVNAEERTVDLAFSSEAPVERWFGDEILSHGEGAVRLDRLNDGAALLVNHDRNDVIGVVVSASIDGDGRGRAVVRFGKSARAEEIFADVRDGIRRHVSVGYLIHEVSVEYRDEDPDRVTVTDWEPYEVSLVSIPADPSVGVGRSMPGTAPEERSGLAADDARDTGRAPEVSDKRSVPMKTKILRNAKGQLVRAEVDEDGAIVREIEVLEEAGEAQEAARRSATEAEQSRVREILTLGEQYGAEDLARDHVRDGRSPAEMQRALLDHLQQARGASTSRSGEVGLSDSEQDRFSFIRAIRALANPTDRRAREAAAFEFECSDAAAERMGREAQGIMVPAEVLTRAINTSTVGTAPGDTGGYSIATDLLSQSFIDMLRNRAILMRLATPIGGLVGNIEIPGQQDGATGYWIGEDEEAVEQTQDLGQIALTPKTVAAYSEITRKLLKQSSIDIEGLVRRDLAAALALTVDRSGFYGAGGSEPLGILNLPGLGVIDFAGVNPTYDEVVAMESEISAANADVQSMAYAMGARMRGALKTTEKFPGSNGAPVWEAGNTVNGYMAEVSNQIGVGDLFHGNFADLLIGMWGGLDINVDPYTHSTRGRLRIVMMQDVDVAARRVESFVLGRKPGV